MAKKEVGNLCDKPFYVEWYGGSSYGWKTLKRFKTREEAEKYKENLDDWHRSSAFVRKASKCE